LPQSFHGDPANPRQDYVVHTEFGADAWTYLFEAGFSDISMHAVEYPAALAFGARVSKMGTVMGASCPHS
jgi:hypothetical protein